MVADSAFRSPRSSHSSLLALPANACLLIARICLLPGVMHLFLHCVLYSNNAYRPSVLVCSLATMLAARRCLFAPSQQCLPLVGACLLPSNNACRSSVLVCSLATMLAARRCLFAPSQQCLPLVGACLLPRNNAYRSPVLVCLFALPQQSLSVVCLLLQQQTSSAFVHSRVPTRRQTMHFVLLHFYTLCVITLTMITMINVKRSLGSHDTLSTAVSSLLLLLLSYATPINHVDDNNNQNDHHDRNQTNDRNDRSTMLAAFCSHARNEEFFCNGACPM